MNLLGIGTDIVNIKRIKRSLRNNIRLKKKIFTQNEINLCEKKKKPESYFAKRFAAKEALVKAMGTGFSLGITFNKIEVLNNTTGKPFFKLSNSINKKIKEKTGNKKFSIFLSISDDDPWAIATVVISF